jgi:hypothetical protein
MTDVVNVLAQQGGNFFDIANYLISNTESVLKVVGTVVAIGLVIFTYAKTRAWVPTLLMLGLAGVVLYGINNTPTLQDTTTETIDAGRAGAGNDG